MFLKYLALINTLINVLKFWMQGDLKILSSQGIKNSLSNTYLNRLPFITNDDICIYINDTYLIFHKDSGLSICNKYNVISSELLVFDHRDGFSEPVSLIEPFDESDKDKQPKVIVEKYLTLV